MPGPDPSANTSNATRIDRPLDTTEPSDEFEISHRFINRDLPISRMKLNRRFDREQTKRLVHGYLLRKRFFLLIESSVELFRAKTTRL